VHARHHVFDRAVLTGRVHALEHDQERMRTHGREYFLQLRQADEIALELLLGVGFLCELTRFARIEIRDPDRPARPDEQIFFLHAFTVSNSRNPSSSTPAMPSDSALASFEPASSPATT